MAVCAAFLVSLDKKYGHQHLILYSLLLSMLLLGWLEIANRTPARISLLVNSRLIRFASDTSYSVYLFHGFFISASGLILSKHAVLQALPAPQRVLIMFLFVTAFSYLTAYLVYRSVELPGIRLGKKVIQRMAPMKKMKEEAEREGKMEEDQRRERIAA
jgi:peptidoglycan/LPS O-acetylase OafA/YrhL